LCCYSLQFCNLSEKWISRGIITAATKWRGRSSVERAAAILFACAGEFFIRAAIRPHTNGELKFKTRRRQKKSKKCLHIPLQICNDRRQNPNLTYEKEVFFARGLSGAVRRRHLECIAAIQAIDATFQRKIHGLELLVPRFKQQQRPVFLRQSSMVASVT
jgi:hypothetical protein